ncbi:hypothetical protein [Parabacteroides sp. AM08-6]|uniref:hypothetical protein n=1 Tax=Parabacteroides sp. AM08-6 TaxID=2292053 RepID=UPI000EFE4A6B|nr:hypothetical protein [Parabacteroides sp. AM08-6]RHJ76220.1 hypothetical protein DW103_17075 [Parabacteroides sp. AM08-6]
MAPDYFLDCANIDEIADFLKGASIRSHDAWEQARFKSFIIARAFGCDAETVEEFMPFPWDDNKDVEVADPVNMEALSRLRKEAKEFEKDLKNG